MLVYINKTNTPSFLYFDLIYFDLFIFFFKTEKVDITVKNIKKCLYIKLEKKRGKIKREKLKKKKKKKSGEKKKFFL